jgi:predicted dinucleotide-binding enzyme
MKIGIIGAGQIGSVVARLAVKNGHEVLLSNSRGPDTLRGLAAEIGCQVGTSIEAARFGDLVVVTIPLKNYRSVPAAPLVGKAVIDTMNYYPQRDGQIEALDLRKTTTSQLVGTHLQGAKIVKAFNAIIARDLETDGRPPQTANRRALPIAGEDASSKRLVTALQEQFGFDTLDAGTLSDSWRFERDKPAYCEPLSMEGLHAALNAAEREVEVP